MFGPSFFGTQFFGPGFFGGTGSPTPPPTGSGLFFGPSFFGSSFFGPGFFPGAITAIPIPPRFFFGGWYSVPIPDDAQILGVDPKQTTLIG